MSRRLMSRSRSGSSSTSRISLVFIAFTPSRSMTASAAAGATTATAATTSYAIAHQTSLHVAQRLQLLDRLVGLLLFIADGFLTLAYLRLEHRGQLFDRRRSGIVFRDVVEQLQCSLIVRRRRAQHGVQNGEPHAVRVGALTCQRRGSIRELAAEILRG